MIEPSCPDAHLSTVSSVRMMCHPVRTPDRSASSVRMTCSFRPNPYTVSRRFCSSLHPSERFSSTSGRLSVLERFSDSFQVPRKGRSINCPDACFCKARIAIQIQPSERLTAVVRTRVQHKLKLPIRLQLSGRLPLMVWTHTLQIWKLRVEELPSGRSPPWSGRAKPDMEITCSGRATVRTMFLYWKDFQ